jgi:hypothetical protein
MKTTQMSIWLIIAGCCLVGAGTYSAFPLKINRDLVERTLPTAVFLTVIMVWGWVVGKSDFLRTGTDNTVRISGQYLLVLMLLMPVIGYSMPLTSYYTAKISAALKGHFGYVWALLSAPVCPGGNGYSGVISQLWPVNPAIRPVLLYTLTAIPLLSFAIYMMRVLGLGTEIAREMYKANFFAAIWLMPGFWLYGKLFFK